MGLVARGRQGWPCARGVSTMSGYVPHEKKKDREGERENAFHARFSACITMPLARRYEDKEEGGDDSQCTLQRFYVINTDALAGI